MSSWHHRAILTLGLRPLANHFAEAYYGLRLRSAAFRRAGNPILVYQMGKVGSSSLSATLEKLVPERMVYHIHRLTHEGLNDIERQSILYGRAYPGPDYWAARYVQRRLAMLSGGRWSLISMTRDPVARNVSGFFQSLPLWSSDALKRFSAGANETLFEELLDIFLRNYPHHKSHSWFDAELKPVFDIDVYGNEFDKSSGYSIYHSSKADLLVIRLEDLSICYRQALTAFLDIDASRQPLIRVNEAAGKEYSGLYREFLDWLILPKDYLESQYTTRYAYHFYTEAELNQFRQKWLKV